MTMPINIQMLAPRLGTWFPLQATQQDVQQAVWHWGDPTEYIPGKPEVLTGCGLPEMYLAMMLRPTTFPPLDATLCPGCVKAWQARMIKLDAEAILTHALARMAELKAKNL